MKSLLLLLMMTMSYPAKRQVLLFYSTGGIALKNKQLNLLQHYEKEVQERDIKILLYKISEATSESKKWKIPPSANFQFILVGKDGGEKLRTDTIVDMQQLFDLIDAMPMRKTEMKNKN